MPDLPVNMKYISIDKANKRKAIRVGETVMGHCVYCGSACLMTKLPNGHYSHLPIYTNLVEAEKVAKEKKII